MIFIDDVSGRWYRDWMKMKSPGFEPPENLDTELEIFAYNLASSFFRDLTRFQPDRFIVALDSKEWRTPFFNNYYLPRVNFWKSKSEKSSWVLGFNNSFQVVKKDSRTDSWKKKKANKTEEKELDLDNPDKWVFFKAGKTPDEIIKAYPDTFKSVRDCPEWEVLKDYVPAYKGNRDKDFSLFETSYEDFKELARNATFHLAALAGAEVVEAGWAEFDDIAATVVEMNPAEEIIISSTDQDMDQLKAAGLFVNIWNSGTGHDNPARWVDMSAKLSEFHLLCKLVGGDGSDGIHGITTKEDGKEKTWGVVSWEVADKSKVKKGKLTEKFCRRLMEENGNLKGVHRWLMEHQIDETYSRNLALMHLSAAPLQIRENCKRALKQAIERPPKHEWDNFFLGEKARRKIANEALKMRAEDMAGGWYSGKSFPEEKKPARDRLGSAL